MTQEDFQLLETMLYESDAGIELWPYHQARLLKSVKHFGWKLELDILKIKQDIDNEIELFIKDKKGEKMDLFNADQLAKSVYRLRIRFLLSINGTYEIQVANQEPMSYNLSKLPTVRVVLDSSSIDQNDPFLLFKTTHRKIYNEARSRAGINPNDKSAPFDVILFNQNNEITETSIANLALETSIDGQKKFITPKLSCGLLMGTKRSYLLENDIQFVEGIITKGELIEAVKDGRQLLGFNSVRGIFNMKLEL